MKLEIRISNLKKHWSRSGTGFTTIPIIRGQRPHLQRSIVAAGPDQSGEIEIARSALECWDVVTAFDFRVTRFALLNEGKAATPVAALQTLAEVWMFVENDV